MSFIATNDAIFEVMVSWSPEYHAPDLEKLQNIVAQQRNRETKMCIVKVVERKSHEQEAATQGKAVEETTIENMVQTTTMPTEETEEGQELFTKQDIQGESETQECMDLTTKVTQLKWSRDQE